MRPLVRGDLRNSQCADKDYLCPHSLNFNHYLMREMAGYLTHPDIPLAVPQLRIADVGTGTG